MKKVYIFLLLIIVQSICLSQSYHNEANNSYAYITAGSNTGRDILTVMALVINPDLIIEGSKAYFGLTKELSAGIYPLGRAAIEYTYIFFRTERKNSIRLSYNQEIPVAVLGQSGGIFLSPGAGYYTDFVRKGWFAQVSIGLMGSPIGGIFRIHPNIKARKTFVKDNPGIFDISLGVGISFYY